MSATHRLRDDAATALERLEPAVDGRPHRFFFDPVKQCDVTDALLTLLASHDPDFECQAIFVYGNLFKGFVPHGAYYHVDFGKGELGRCASDGTIAWDAMPSHGFRRFAAGGCFATRARHGPRWDVFFRELHDIADDGCNDADPRHAVSGDERESCKGAVGLHSGRDSMVVLPSDRQSALARKYESDRVQRALCLKKRGRSSPVVFDLPFGSFAGDEDCENGEMDPLGPTPLCFDGTCFVEGPVPPLGTRHFSKLYLLRGVSAPGFQMYWPDFQDISKDICKAHPPSGLKWKKHAGTKPPTAGKNISNEELQDALGAGQLNFTEEQWKRFEIKEDLTINHFVEVGNSYYQPTDPPVMSVRKILKHSHSDWPTPCLYVQGDNETLAFVLDCPPLPGMLDAIALLLLLVPHATPETIECWKESMVGACRDNDSEFRRRCDLASLTPLAEAVVALPARRHRDIAP